MAGMRPGGFSDDENSDEDQFLDYDETVNGQYVNRSKAAASVRTQVWSQQLLAGSCVNIDYTVSHQVSHQVCCSNIASDQI